jgi:hypothetical protein
MVQQEENRRQSGGSSRAARASIEATLTFLRKELAKTQRLVQQQVERSAELRSQQQLLCSIPGVGRYTTRHAWPKPVIVAHVVPSTSRRWWPCGIIQRSTRSPSGCGRAASGR